MSLNCRRNKDFWNCAVVAVDCAHTCKMLKLADFAIDPVRQKAALFDTGNCVQPTDRIIVMRIGHILSPKIRPGKVRRSRDYFNCIPCDKPTYARVTGVKARLKCVLRPKRFCSVQIYTKMQYTRERAWIGSKRIRTPNSLARTSEIPNTHNLTVSSERFNRTTLRAFVEYTFPGTYCVLERRRVADKGPLKTSCPGD